MAKDQDSNFKQIILLRQKLTSNIRLSNGKMKNRNNHIIQIQKQIMNSTHVLEQLHRNLKKYKKSIKIEKRN
ncbi:unnamed protein product [Paramecium sonneborni]|uniref:Ribosomal protein L29 n=1 Tax=Paramecium sonneborni TaxID=65129 RepID=A0A8S1QFW2_9CILI|nr:unnamed protein product [Paramecium sonneborni]